MESTESTISLREQVKTTDIAEFVKAHTKPVLLEIAEGINIDAEKLANAKTKQEVADLIYRHFPLPDPSLRGKSNIEDPVAYVWAYAENQFAAYRANPESPKPRRKDVVDQLVLEGVAYYTARTQYQAWFKYSNGGTLAIAGPDEGLPKDLLKLLGIEVPAEAVKTEA